MVKPTLIVAYIFSFCLYGQKEVYIQPGLIKSSLTISPSWMLNKPEFNYYLSGFLEGYLEKKISLRGETHYFVDGKKETPFLKFNSATYFGVLYHVNKNNTDAHIGFMPGISIMQINNEHVANDQNKTQIAPSFSANLGVTFYVWKYCHFFANITYMHATLRGVRGASGRADELMISAGLGFNFNAIKAQY